MHVYKDNAVPLIISYSISALIISVLFCQNITCINVSSDIWFKLFIMVILGVNVCKRLLIQEPDCE